MNMKKTHFIFAAFVLLVICMVLLCGNKTNIESTVASEDNSEDFVSVEESADAAYVVEPASEPEPAPEPEPEPEIAVESPVLPSEYDVKGIYVSGAMAGTTSGMDALIALLDETELNTMVIDVKNDAGEVTFSISDETVQAIGATRAYIKDINALMTTLKEHGIHTVARIVCFKDPVLAAARPEFAIRNSNGVPVAGSDQMTWVDPYKEEVWEYIVNVALGAAEAGFDEIQFDYVRFPVGVDAVYEVSTNEYPKETAITNFLTYAVNRLHEAGVIVGVDLFGTVIGSEEDTKSVGQNYTALGAIADVLDPMVYPSHYANGSFGQAVPDAAPYETIYGAMQKSDAALSSIAEEERATVRPWLQCFTATWIKGHITYDRAAIDVQIQAASDCGYTQYILWNSKNNYDVMREMPAEALAN